MTAIAKVLQAQSVAYPSVNFATVVVACSTVQDYGGVLYPTIAQNDARRPYLAVIDHGCPISNSVIVQGDFMNTPIANAFHRAPVPDSEPDPIPIGDPVPADEPAPHPNPESR